MLIDLDAACRVVCSGCSAGAASVQDGFGRWRHRTHSGLLYACAADALRKLAEQEGVTTAGAAVGALVKVMDEEEETNG